MAEAHPINLELWEDRDKIVAVQHGIEPRLLEVRCKFDRGVSVNVDQHKLVDDVLSKIGKMHQGGGNLYEITSGDWAIDAQVVRFEKDSFFLQPG